MRIESCFLLGVFSSKYSFKGELLLKLKIGDPEYCLGILDVCFVSVDDNLVPHFVTSKSLHKSFIRIQLEGIDDECSAENLLGKEVYMPSEKLFQIKGNDSSYYHKKYVDYKVFEGEEYLGRIKEILDLKQPLICLQTKSEKEILIPFVKNFIKKTDERNNIIYVILPKGLLEMNP
jgi:16S rRNA processing protein RimM